jgi:hypothetical protein
MSQQINLLNPALIKKTELLNPNSIGLLLGVLLIGMLAYYQFESNALTQLTQRREQLAAQVTAMDTQVTEMRAAKLAHTGNSALLETIKQLEAKTIMQEEIIKAVSSNSAQSSRSYAALLKAFSKQSIDGLWITGLSIDQDAEALSIKGRALHADLLPTFIARLRAEPALKGKTFTDLKMQSTATAQEKPELKNSAHTAIAAGSPQVAETAKTNSQVSVNAAQTQSKNSMPAYIEFTLHSVTEKNKPETLAAVGVEH